MRRHRVRCRTWALATTNKILICIFQRGAVDGLSMVVPHGDPHYYLNRPDISLKAPSQAAGADGVLDLDGYFGFNPALKSLLPLFQQGQLAAIQACGSPNSSRSHFESQDLMESGVDEGNGVRDGWLNRMLGCCPEDAAKHSAFRAVSTTAITPRSLQGEQDSLAIRDLDTFGLAGDKSVTLAGPTGTANGFENMYASAVDTVLHGTARESFDALGMLDKIRRLVRLIRAGEWRGLSAGTAHSGKNLAPDRAAHQGQRRPAGRLRGSRRLGHARANQGNAKGILSTRLGNFSQAVAALHQDLGDRMADVVLVTMSEFGRTVHENGNRGTDHGHGTCFFAMGGPIKGGKVYGDWPTLAPDKLFQNRDLAVTTDFREVFGEIVSRHFGVPMADMATLFPQYSVDASRFRNFYAA